MKTARLVFWAALCALVVPLSALPTQVTYTDGDVSVKQKSGTTQDLNIGDTINTGDTIRTGADGNAELNQNGVTIRINPKTVFVLQQKAVGGQTRDVASVSLGSIKMKYDKLTGTEPLVQTASCAAGIRGTELTVLSGEDGSSLIAVDSGAVQVEAEGKTVDLAPGEGVEVAPGQQPGDKFKVLSGMTDYSRWNGDKVKKMLADPEATMDSLLSQLESYAKSMADSYADYQDYSKRLTETRKKTSEILAQDGVDAAKKFQQETEFPLAKQTGNIFLNVRFYALEATSLRRYVAGRVYVLLKGHNIEAATPQYSAFLEKYQDFLKRFETDIVPQLVDADI